MFSRGGFDARASRRKLPGTQDAIDMLATLSPGDPDKALVMKYVGQLVAAGYAELEMRDNGEVEARLTSGETYLLAETTILRLA
ncbi:hypothetical protein N183_14505 [Sinorhizobium sp. Sb3]|uniref:hypothetical protein n=1 Tax=Sinorhizobium/Ensifer group TaxID=227292 RepID=UPI00071DB1EF|nr:hypothetical protein [Sinorhizobium sp. Sb3]KSV81720.1 hypothetical protein N183_14505 [Sinorhizobium sp. Sb3]